MDQIRLNVSVDLAGVAVMLLLTAIVSVGAILPVFTARVAHRALEERLEAGRMEVRDLREQRSDLELNLVRLENDLKETRVDVEPVARLNSRISRLTESAFNRKLALDRVAPDAPQRAAKATLVPIRIEGRGAFLSSRDWISDLRSEFPDIAVAGFQIARDNSSRSDSASFSFDLVWYAAPSAPTAQAAPKK
ncbi:MAG: hypothetical protein KF691_11285 [Phycisphaeraceae bacterium]|nr:hypothetical protein [Phycisphaeraceae bacterium]